MQRCRETGTEVAPLAKCGPTKPMCGLKELNKDSSGF